MNIQKIAEQIIAGKSKDLLELLNKTQKSIENFNNSSLEPNKKEIVKLLNDAKQKIKSGTEIYTSIYEINTVSQATEFLNDIKNRSDELPFDFTKKIKEVTKLIHFATALDSTTFNLKLAALKDSIQSAWNSSENEEDFLKKIELYVRNFKNRKPINVLMIDELKDAISSVSKEKVLLKTVSDDDWVLKSNELSMQI